MCIEKCIKVSVIIPTYKRGPEYLLRAINSVLEQTYANIEIVVVDDNPPESNHRQITQGLMQAFEQNSQVKYIKNRKNMGGAQARNVGIREAQGDYITFLDDDDEYLPEKVSKQVAFMERTNSDLSFSNLKLVNEDGVVVDYREHKGLKGFDKKTLLKYHLMKHLTGTPTFMFRAEKLKKIGGFDDVPMGQEFYLMVKAIEQDLKISYLESCDVIAYRHRDGGISFGQNKLSGERRLYDFKKSYFKIFSFRERMFIRFRHHVVMAIAYFRNKNAYKAVIHFLCAAIASPVDFVKEATIFVANILKHRNKRQISDV